MTDPINDFLADCEEDVRNIADAAVALLKKKFPAALLSYDGEHLGFGTAPGYKGLKFVLSAHAAWVDLGVFDAVQLPDPAKLLEGTGKRHRHVKLREIADVRNPALIDLIEAAMAR